MISVETVAQTWQEISAYCDDEATQLINQMSIEQPIILAYLLASSEDELFDEDEGQLVLYIGVVVWQIMERGFKDLRRVTEEGLNKAQRANEDLLVKLAADSAGDFLSASESLVDNYAEPEVLRYITEALMEDEEGDPDNPPMREESLGQAFLHLKIVLDAFVENNEQ
ncbi:MAG: hypothetical protein FJ215_04680 [Ignavibacteria bacterium]|nr:hypothetical protein [Ignavibacteria bacterium]